jgi:long-chain acyl-CoA synthetase
MASLEWIAAGARIESDRTGNASPLDVTGLSRQVDGWAALIRRSAGGRNSVIGLSADNGVDWIAFDLAARSAGAILVPLPDFFSNDQLRHAVGASGMQALATDCPERAARLGFHEPAGDRGRLRLFRRASPPAPFASRFGRGSKITFTSGTTASPRGVVLSAGQQLAKTRALASAVRGLSLKRHLCMLPLPVLLENIAGAYAALMLGGTCICPRLAAVGVSGASGFDPDCCLEALARYRPDSIILLPQMLRVLMARMAGRPALGRGVRSLRFIALGGAPTPVPVIAAARRLGLPVYEGYGLTECASVVSLNLPGADLPGSVGRALPGVALRLAPDGELEVGARAHGRYLDLRGAPGYWLPTGDLAAIDDHGFVTLTGRKKNVLVTSYGRNISPEWPEGLLLSDPSLAQAVVFGDAQPYLVAVLVALAPHTEEAVLGRAVTQANARLPDYARIRRWIRAPAPFTVANGLATPNGRIRRDAVARAYAEPLRALYDSGEAPEYRGDGAPPDPMRLAS